MANSEFLRQLGLFTVKEFLTPEECATLRNLASASKAAEATIYRDGEIHLDEETRKTLDVNLIAPMQLDVERRMGELGPALERHFGLELDGHDNFHWLMYRAGDFFRLHADVAPAGTIEESGPFRNLARRAVSVVVFMNDHNNRDEPYEGGSLTLYGLMKTPGAKDYGFPVDAETGLLIAFASDTPHEVSPIISGKRYTLVTWFFAQKPKEKSDADHSDIQTEIQGNS